MKIFSISLGCAKNKVDSEVLLGNLCNNPSIELTTEFEDADLIFINTCAFIESAKEEAISTIFDCVNSKKENQKILVCGCLPTRYKEEIKELIPEVDRFVEIWEYKNLDKIINAMFSEHPFTNAYDPLCRMITSAKESVYVKISEGCNHFCAYCAIPLIRGRFQTRPKEEIISECKELVANGAREINLISQDTTDYGHGMYKDYDIVNLMADVEAIPGDFKIRLLYLYPSLITDRFIDYIAASKKVVPYFDVPIQHSETRILKKMFRIGDKEFLTELFKKIRTRIPNAILRTTLIVGFPSETEEEFNSLLDFIKEVKFDRLGAFTYSPEEGTKGAEMPDQIEEEVKNKRLEALYMAQDPVALEMNSLHVGEVMDCLVESYDEQNYCYLGRSYAFAPDDIDGAVVIYSNREIELGEVVRVKIVNATIDSLEGTEVEA